MDNQKTPDELLTDLVHDFAREAKLTEDDACGIAAVVCKWFNLTPEKLPHAVGIMADEGNLSRPLVLLTMARMVQLSMNPMGLRLLAEVGRHAAGRVEDLDRAKPTPRREQGH